MKEAKSENIPLTLHMKFSIAQSPKTENEITEMKNVLYANAIRSVIFSMITTMLDLAYAISFLIRFMSNPWKLIGLD